MIRKHIPQILYLIVFWSYILSFSGCSTGIESTKTIKYTKAEKKESAPSEEEKLISDIAPTLLKDWKKGKTFMISDDRVKVIMESSSHSDQSSLQKGKTITFDNISQRITPGGNTVAIITFTDGDNFFSYATGRSLKNALENINSLDIPMLLDLQMVESYHSLLSDKQLWTKTRLWYDKDGEKIQGKQFVPVNITNVEPGDMNFLMKLSVRDSQGKDFLLYMNAPNRGLESRTFPFLFSLSDPRLSHQGISDETWERICSGNVVKGMTKEECKLALGNPDDVSTGHDWNRTIDIWNYKDGSFLLFSDGLLDKYRY